MSCKKKRIGTRRAKVEDGDLPKNFQRQMTTAGEDGCRELVLKEERRFVLAGCRGRRQLLATNCQLGGQQQMHPQLLERRLKEQHRQLMTLRQVFAELKTAVLTIEGHHLALLSQVGMTNREDDKLAALEQQEANLQLLVKELEDMTQGLDISDAPRKNFKPDLTVEDELQETCEALRKARDQSEASKKGLRETRRRLQGAEAALDQSQEHLEMSRQEAEELKQRTHHLSQILMDRQEGLVMANEALKSRDLQLKRCRQALSHCEARWRMAERRCLLLRRNRSRLLTELLSTRNLMAEGIAHLKRGSRPHSDSQLLHHELGANSDGSSNQRPLSTVDSGHYSPSESDQEEPDDRRQFEPETTVLELRRHLIWLKQQFQQAESEWEEERCTLGRNLLEREETVEKLEREVQQVEEDRSRLLLLEEKLRDTLTAVFHCKDLNRRTLGRIVLEALEESVCPTSKECNPAKFLSILYCQTLEYEQVGQDSLLHLALHGI